MVCLANSAAPSTPALLPSSALARKSLIAAVLFKAWIYPPRSSLIRSLTKSSRPSRRPIPPPTMIRSGATVRAILVSAYARYSASSFQAGCSIDMFSGASPQRAAIAGPLASPSRQSPWWIQRPLNSSCCPGSWNAHMPNLRMEGCAHRNTIDYNTCADSRSYGDIYTAMRP